MVIQHYTQNTKKPPLISNSSHETNMQVPSGTSIQIVPPTVETVQTSLLNQNKTNTQRVSSEIPKGKKKSAQISLALSHCPNQKKREKAKILTRKWNRTLHHRRVMGCGKE
jgi:multidrug efflux pump subunit AcrB